MDSAPHIKIDRCVCKEMSFQELIEMASILGNDLDMIALSTGASIECGTCRPWLKQALEIGIACFEVDPAEIPDGEELLAHFGAGRCD